MDVHYPLHPPGLDQLPACQRGRELSGVERGNAAARETTAEPAEVVIVLAGSRAALGMSGCGRHQPAEALDRSDHGLAADDVDGQLREALVVRGGERSLEAHLVAAAGRPDPRGRQSVWAPAIAAAAPRFVGRAVEGRCGRHDLHQGRGRIGRCSREVLCVGRYIREDAARVRFEDDDVALGDAAPPQQVEDESGELDIHRVLDPQGASQIRAVHRRLHPLDETRRIPRRTRVRCGNPLEVGGRAFEFFARGRNPLEDPRRRWTQPRADERARRLRGDRRQQSRSLGFAPLFFGECREGRGHPRQRLAQTDLRVRVDLPDRRGSEAGAGHQQQAPTFRTGARYAHPRARSPVQRLPPSVRFLQWGMGSGLLGLGLAGAC